MCALLALVRDVPDSLAECQLSHLERTEISVPRARRQHSQYRQALEQAGCRVESLPSTPHLPDSVFVEDVAVVLPELAVLTRPGAQSRRAEVSSMRDALAPHRHIAEITAPATLDGGDVLVLERTLFVGASGRSNAHAIEQLTQILFPHEYTVRPVPISGCLHLKSAVSRIAEDVLLCNPECVDASIFESAGYRCTTVDAHEPMAANALLVGDTLLFPDHFPRTAERVRALGTEPTPLACDELAKAEAGLTCCSVVFEA